MTRPAARGGGRVREAGPRVQRFRVGEAHRGERLDRFLQAMLPRLSRSAAQAAVAEGRVTLASGAEPKVARRLVLGEVVDVEPRRVRGEPPARPATLVAGDGWQVLDKPAGLGSTPTARHPGRDVVTLTGLAPAHRLDRFTSGCLLVTSAPGPARRFAAAFAERRVRKIYAAVIHGRPARDAWTCEAPLVADPSSRVPGRVRAAAPRGGRGRAASTAFAVVARGEDRALVRAEPATGRRHQVRAHLADAGHPVVGDLLHGGDERAFIRLQLEQAGADAPAGLVPGRFLLHARSLEAEAPEGGSFRAVAPWPADFPEDLVREWDAGFD